MRNLPTSVKTHLAQSSAFDVHVLIWLTARNRTTGLPESLGIWTGADHQTITVDGDSRTYYGVGALLDVEPFNSRAALEERSWSVSVSPLHAAVVEAIRTYDARLAPVEAHEWYFDPETNTAVADPIRAFRGTVMVIDMPTPELGQEAAAKIQCVSDAWRLTRGLTLKRSNEALLTRAPTDKIRQYNSLVGIETAWGESKASDGNGGANGGSWGVHFDGRGQYQ